MSPQISPDRLISDLETLRTFGAHHDGVVRLAFSKEDMDARCWLVDRMIDAGLHAAIDGVGTVFGKSTNNGNALVMGSHSDTQPRGGWLDGALGVIYALETVRAIAEDPVTQDLPLDIASWADEEATYLGLLGSASFTERLSSQEIDAHISKSGECMADVFQRVGLAGRERVVVDPARHKAYLEAHIEQGPVLEHEGRRLGVVTAIVGNRTFDITFTGEQNHAGGTPMALRRDAGAALIDFAAMVRAELCAMMSTSAVLTIGHVKFDPNADCIIPGKAKMTLQFRSPSDTELSDLEGALKCFLNSWNDSHDVPARISAHADNLECTNMDEVLQKLLVDASKIHAPDNWMSMPSGGGHDAQLLARRMPAAMLFVPSIGGISHDFKEDTHEADIILGCQVAATAASSILQRLNKD